MRKDQVQRLASHVAASYVSREVDLHWMDKLAKTRVGKKLRALPTGGKYALEFMAYLGSAFVANSNSSPSAFRLFVNQVLADMSQQFARRILEPNTVDPAVVQAIVLDMTDQEVVEVLALVKSEMPVSGATADQSPKRSVSPIGQLADRINESRQELRKRAWRQTK